MNKLLSTATKIFLLAALLALAGCNLPVKTRITPTPAAKVQTSTAAAARTQTAQAANKKPTQIATAAPTTALPPPPTKTTQPTLEMAITEIVPTATVTATATQQVTSSPTAGAYKCGITFVSPTTGTEIKKGSSFDFKVTFRNDGAATWKPATVFYTYLSGPKFQKGADLVKLTSDVAPGQLVTLTVPMAATSGSGPQNINWGLENAGAYFCYVGVSVIIK